ncbi:hypothetical protein TCE0_042r14205 [Talaromyces pinophilus]|uniref:Uncharacterized protein n=1 Tax=Talaromyces pinophilus TaxID=128442 RepID=A0A6V8HH90_TALPI|nr:hypothetical protein TCE0_042r14205 [Talaromyces pinophilus]
MMDTTLDEAGPVTLLNRFVGPNISEHPNSKENNQSITNETTENELLPETLLVDEDDVGDWIELSLFLCELDTVSETEAGLRERLHDRDLENIHRAFLQNATLRQEPADLIKPQMDITPDLTLLDDDDDLALDLMLQSMLQLLASKGAIAFSKHHKTTSISVSI